MIGKQFGRLKVLSFSGCKKQNKYWECVCECGKIIFVSTNHLNSGHTRSCGCLRKEVTGKSFSKHQLSESPTYQSWAAMKRRCNPNNKNPEIRKHYIEKGITLCDRWQSFENFLADMGLKPLGHTIDRIDNTKGYSPENCRWATNKEQALNRCSTKYFTYKGETLPMTYWAIRFGITKCRIHNWLIKRGKTIEDVAELAV